MDRLELFWFARYVRACMYPDASLQKGWASVNGKSSRLGQDQASRPVQARPACKFGLCTGTTGRGVGGNRPLGFACAPKALHGKKWKWHGQTGPVLFSLPSSIPTSSASPARPVCLLLVGSAERREKREERREKREEDTDTRPVDAPSSSLCALCSVLSPPLPSPLHSAPCSAVQCSSALGFLPATHRLYPAGRNCLPCTALLNDPLPPPRRQRPATSDNETCSHGRFVGSVREPLLNARRARRDGTRLAA